MSATLLFSYNSNIIHGCRKEDLSLPRLFLGTGRRIMKQHTANRNPKYHNYGNKKFPHKFCVYAVTEGSAKSSKSEEKIPSWATPDSEEPPPWAQNEGKEDALQNKLEIPFFVYLLASAVTAIAAIGSVFEYLNQRPVFGILNSDSIFYAPLLGFFAFTGIPTSCLL
ncbi:uncharacterized protein LOC107424279 isoform X3 [Ziziphus jujuba]|uniref:Uncharacterized protein LOC107424279 isoform X3 n=1 Tax=Ziziphus jujuba TaxID=326968 RepID=A0ABM3ITP6_ZIZJJ|nr:uncharacterized protein LOC107424279 isoform X3 [Ziziphus jujuba]